MTPKHFDVITRQNETLYAIVRLVDECLEDGDTLAKRLLTHACVRAKLQDLESQILEEVQIHVADNVRSIAGYLRRSSRPGHNHRDASA